ncbi:hypothetical protein MBLNU457_5370t1 [Dothideomycetes sp. NU457]
MAPASSVLLSPAELSYLHTSLSQNPPIRPDSRSPTQFRPLVAETDIIPSANGSARICFADGTEAIVGIKAEVEKSAPVHNASSRTDARGLGTSSTHEVEMGDVDDDASEKQHTGLDAWLEMAVEIPGFRDDDALPVFLAAMMTEALLADGYLRDKLVINSRFHWRLYVDVLLLSAPLSYPLPLLSLTTHLALLQTRLPALVSEKEEDALFNDDWAAATPLFEKGAKPPVTLLVMSVGQNVVFDPSREELAVADAVVALSVREAGNGEELKLVAVRAVDPPSRLTVPGVPNSMNSVTGGVAPSSKQEALRMREGADAGTVWRPPRGGVKRGLLAAMIKMAVQKEGVGFEVLEALEGVQG